LSVFKLDTNITDKCPKDFYEEPNMVVCSTIKLDDPTLTMCTTGIEATVDTADDEHEKFQLYMTYQDRSKLPLITIEYNDNESRTIFHGDYSVPGAIEGVTVVPFYTGENETCLYQLTQSENFQELMHEFFGVYVDEFTYITKEEMTCEEKKCTRYCNDLYNSTCVYIVDSETPYLLKYESPDKNISYGAPVVVEDMGVFTLNNNSYPGCEKHPTVYQKPEICLPIPIPSPSSSQHYSSQQPSVPKVLSSASTVSATVVTVMLTFFITLLL